MALAHTYAANPHWVPRPAKDALDALPGEDGWPVLGNTLTMLRDPKAFGDAMIAKHGPVYRNHAFGSRTVMLMGADANELVLMDRDKLFSSEQGWGPLLNLLFPRGLMLMDFDHHRSERRVLGVAFKPEPMRHYAQRLDQGIARAVADWTGQREFRFYDAVKQLSLDLAADCFLGMELGAEAAKVNQAFVDEVQASVAPVRRPWPGTLMKKGVEGRRYLVDLFEREVPKRREAGGQDFFSHFCRATDEAGEPLSGTAIADHMNFLMMAAHDTITSSATSMVMLLGRNPEWQERLAGEVAALGGDYPDQLDRLVETEWAFKEALRMVPPVPSLPRRALRDFEFGGYRIPAGSQVGVSVGMTHHSTDYWQEPDRFDPLRFTPEASRGRHRFAWVPFGGGAHMCLGLHFATMQIRLLMAHLLKEHRIELAEGSGEKWQWFPIPRPKDGLPLRLVRAGQ
ncbi:MAG: cytochrome family protein [Sphingomonas bacterium]|uniref:cytochrome P450 n=1 Tax=Sphingomonas bacterium TaxID=1895847 RepID=UPI00260A3DAF|nr:cytochrome P450 [Sphingomonas bacterium]MDB5695728.1 cytochrome family protein [Sphingomonas bacterium]